MDKIFASFFVERKLPLSSSKLLPKWQSFSLCKVRWNWWLILDYLKELQKRNKKLMLNFVFLSFLPNMMEKKVRYHQKLFCGRYSTNGDIFLSACQGLWKFIAFSCFYKKLMIPLCGLFLHLKKKMQCKTLLFHFHLKAKSKIIFYFWHFFHFMLLYKVVLMQWQLSLLSTEKPFTNNYI